MVSGRTTWFRRNKPTEDVNNRASSGATCSSSNSLGADTDRSRSLSVDAAVSFGSAESDCKPRIREASVTTNVASAGALEGCRVQLRKRPGWTLQARCSQPSVAHLLDQDICFGPLMAACSSSQVYHATWGPTEVAVRVIRSSSSSSSSSGGGGSSSSTPSFDLIQHTQQLVALDHPSVVRTYCRVTYTQSGAAATANAQLTAEQDATKSSTGSKANRDQGSHGAAAATETWLVQEYCDSSTLFSLASEWQQTPGAASATGALPAGGAAAAAVTGVALGGPTPAGVAAVDAQMLERLGLLADVAQGLKFLHDRGIVHGGLGASSVLVTTSTKPRTGLTAKILHTGLLTQQHTGTGATGAAGNSADVAAMRLRAPEVLRLGAAALRPESDVYGFGILMWEAYTGQGAYGKLLDPAHLYEAIVIQNLRPKIPAGMPADYQLLMERCWSSDPSDRPSADKLIGCLAAMAAERNRRVSFCCDRQALLLPSGAAAAAAVGGQEGGLRVRSAGAPAAWAAAGPDGLRARSAPLVHNRPSCERGACDRASLQQDNVLQQQEGPNSSRTLSSSSPQLGDQSNRDQGSNSSSGGTDAAAVAPQQLQLGPDNGHDAAATGNGGLQGASLLHHKSCPAPVFHALLLQSGSFTGRRSADADRAAAADDTAYAELLEEDQMLQQLRANSQTQSGPGSAPLLHSTQPHQRYADGLDLGLLQLDDAHMWHI